MITKIVSEFDQEIPQSQNYCIKNKEQTQNLHIGSNNKQWINNKRTMALERTAA